MRISDMYGAPQAPGAASPSFTPDQMGLGEVLQRLLIAQMPWTNASILRPRSFPYPFGGDGNYARNQMEPVGALNLDGDIAADSIDLRSLIGNPANRGAIGAIR